MRRHRSIEELPDAPQGRAVAIGAFDGVHLGHQEIIRQAVEAAADAGIPSTVITFDPNPLAVLRPELKTTVLTGSDLRARLIGRLGADELLEIPFTDAFSRIPWDRFAEMLFSRPIAARSVSVGRNFRFGHRGEGTAKMLADAGRARGVEVRAPGLVTSPDGKPISSTRVRRLIAQGDVEDAQGLLGRPHCLDGVVVHGDGRGAGLGIPTANIALAGRSALPGRGVYAGQMLVRGAVWPAAVNVGFAPTFRDAHDLRVEAFLIGYGGDDLYDEPVHVAFLRRLRGEQRFASSEALVTQVKLDIRRAAQIGEGAAPPLC